MAIVACETIPAGGLHPQSSRLGGILIAGHVCVAVLLAFLYFADRTWHWFTIPVIVATDLPTLRESLPPSHHRFMFDADDDDGAISSIMEILRDEGLRSSLSSDARQWAAELSEKNDYRRLISFYDQIIS